MIGGRGGVGEVLRGVGGNVKWCRGGVGEVLRGVGAVLGYRRQCWGYLMEINCGVY